ncbi:protein kinase domain-containing protein [Paraclostridium bifermentans]|uniref:serine/threonine-protein kinase n=1 Tax=Paraclostridium bifermentans TaxID=1490 RepID=UPI001FF2D2D0|nr:serine/threonine-protein kinase [Paraclostridium bifermentans]UOW69067.1 protein kinase [Paraclostridium bifermentans]
MRKKNVNFHPQVDMNIGDKYLLKEFIDEGSFGYVWKAKNLHTNEVVAIKIPKNQEKADSTLSEGKEFVGENHENVIKINWMGRVDGVFIIEMEYFHGHKLSDELCDEGFKSPKTFDEIYNIFIQVLDAIEYIHSKSICHGDIKPQNIMISGDVVKITDFGTSKLIEDLFIKTIDGGGTWEYMAPEVAGSNKRYLNSDIYALGVLMYKFLTGRTPHETANQIIHNIPYPKPREINNNIPKDIEEIVLKLLQRNPEERYKCVKEVKYDFKNILISSNSSVITYKSNCINKSDTENWIEDVISRYKISNYDEAEIILKTEYENNNKSSDVLYHMGYTYFKQGRYFDSINLLSNINLNDIEDIRKSAIQSDIIYLKGRVCIELKRYDDAIKCFKKLLKDNEDNLDYKYKLACVYGLNDEQEEAIELLEEINKSTPGMLYIVKKLGHGYDQLKDYKKAKAYFKYALKLDPDDSVINNRISEYDKYIRYI